MVLTTCGTHEEKTRIWALAQAWAVEAHSQNPNENQVGAEAVPRVDPGWKYQANENGQEEGSLGEIT